MPFPIEYDSLKMNFLGITFLNPFCLASGPVGNDRFMVARAFEVVPLIDGCVMEAGWGSLGNDRFIIGL